MSPPTICGARLLGNLGRLASFGARPDGGVDRVAGSPADLAARRWLGDYLSARGLITETDESGNVLGRAPSSQGPWLLAGSHTDTVPAGGRLDGAYGVMAAVEVLETLHEHGHPAACKLQVVSFWDEEGATPQSAGGMVGSKAFLCSQRMNTVSAFLELHIEQGKRMESQSLELCVVDGVVGVDRYYLSMLGEANHAGTTCFEDRHDAGRAAVRTAATVQDLIRGIDESIAGNVGYLGFEPGAPNVVPGSAHMVIELRAPADELLSAAMDSVLVQARRVATQDGCALECERLAHRPVMHFDGRMRELLDGVCARAQACGHLLSYAGHDAAIMAERVPTAMLFVPSTGGISHSPLEQTPDRQLVRGAQALLDAVVRYASG